MGCDRESFRASGACKIRRTLLGFAGLGGRLMIPGRWLRATALALVLMVPAAGAKAESLLSAFKYAYLNNPNIMSALLTVKAAAEDVAMRKAGQRPSIGATADYSASFGVA